MTKPGLLNALLLALPFAIAGASAAHAQDSGNSAQDFKLPPAPTATPQVQGPVDPDAPSTKPRVIPTARPTPTPRPAPPVIVPTSEPTPEPVLPNRRFTPAGELARPQASRPTGSVTTPAISPDAETTDFDPAMPLPGLPQPNDAAPSQAQAAAGRAAPGGVPIWLWVAGLLGVLALGALVGRLTSGRRKAQPPEINRPPEIEHPEEPLDRQAALPEPEPEPEILREIPAQVTTPIESGEILAVAFQPLSLAISMMNATLSYRLSITPGADVETDDLTIGADMIAAHASLPVQQQLANPAIMLEERHKGISLHNGESLELNGTITLPISAIRPIRQGNAALFVPLVRLTFDNVGQAVDPMTFVLGEQSALQTGNLQPVRIDEGPRTVRQMIARRLG